jgi:two-component system sensor histidine kinase CpxA
VVDRDGRELVFVARLDQPPRPVDLLEPQALWVRLAGLALVVGLVSLALARYLSRPVAALRAATRRLGFGDLTARVGHPVARRRDEIGALARDFDAMADRVEGLVGSQRRLLRDVSHELRSPLARLRVALEIARREAKPPAAEALDRIEREAGRLDELVGKILLLESLQAGALTDPQEIWDLAGLTREVCDDAAFEARPKRCEIVLESPQSLSFVGSAELMRSALDNIIRNAVRHAPAGSAVEIELRRDGDTVCVAVRDRGSGVPDEQLDLLFEPFARVGEARDRESGGSGLGLAIARRAIELHRGTVSARNREDGGLEVAATVPVGRSADRS